mgnify:CR=1 FL=1
MPLSAKPGATRLTGALNTPVAPAATRVCAVRAGLDRARAGPWARGGRHRDGSEGGRVPGGGKGGARDGYGTGGMMELPPQEPAMAMAGGASWDRYR